MDMPTSSLSHREFPTDQDIIGHESLPIIRERQPNSINDNALAFPDFLESTSTWNQNHIIAFRMIDFNNLSIGHIYPLSYYPSTDDIVIAEAAKLFTRTSGKVK